MPSDTIYGLSCRALDKNAVERLHKLKRREKKPFIVLIADTTQLSKLGIITTDVTPALRYWPGPLTIIVEAEAAPKSLHRGTKTLGVRQPNNPDLLKLMKNVGPLISTSANLAGEQPVNTAAEAQKMFDDTLDFYVDVGTLKSQPSTIIKKDNYKLEIIRQGAIKFREVKNDV